MARTIQQTDLISMRVWTSDIVGETQACVTTFDFSIDPTTFNPGMTDLQLVTAYDNGAVVNWKSLISADAYYRGTQLTYLNVVPLPATQSYNASAGVGSNAGGLWPTQVRGMIKRYTFFAGRKYRGRIFVPFGTVTDLLATGLPQGAYLSALSTMTTTSCPVAGLSFSGGGGTIKLLPILWNRKSHTPTPITAYSTPQYLGTQRKSGSAGRSNVPPI